MIRNAKASSEPSKGRTAQKKKEGSTEEHNPQATRETVESIVVAVILAFLFRAFVAEAFVIPTGSMAPTLQGRHLDVVCPECKYQYRTGASMENDPPRFPGEASMVTHTTCPICRFRFKLDRSEPGTMFLFEGNEDSFNGDRILVSKFAYQLGEPQRWDVIVFKYPGNAKQNYIKRLIGLPGEKLKIKDGDIHIMDQSATGEAARYRIARKPPDKAHSMLQLVDDTNHIAKELLAVGWPSRWQPQSPDLEEKGWKISDDGSQFRVEAGDRETWLRYFHVVPNQADWDDIRAGKLPERLDTYRGQLILDYYAYNDYEPPTPFPTVPAWVGDLAIEVDVEVESDQGELLLKLVEGGRHYECRIDIVSGVATLSISDGGNFVDEETGDSVAEPTGTTKVRGAGSYRLRFANVDDQLFLWVNDGLVEFSGPTTFASPDDVRPNWSREDPHDLAPLGIGARGATVRAKRLRVLRDIYYLALAPDPARNKSEYDVYVMPDEVIRIASDPDQWATTDLFSSRRYVTVDLEENEFFPLGDNSPQSKDARLWSDHGFPPPYVERKYLIGKALIVYWPHAWRPLWPNFSRMGLIR